MSRKRWCAQLALICLWCLTAVSAVFAQAPSTAEERARFVALTHKLESNPLDPALRPETKWALKWLIEVPDIHVSLCSSVLGDYFKYKYSPEITAQLSFSGAAFSIEHPDQAGDQLVQYVASAEGALKAYSAILLQNPKAKSKVLDDVLHKQAQGQLKAFVEDAAAKGCRK
jgi:hypothetical protein